MFDYDKMEYSIQGFFRAKGYGDGLDALEFAKKKHGDARRKASNLKYVCHPILIAYLCTLLRLEPEIVAIAYCTMFLKMHIRTSLLCRVVRAFRLV